MKMKVSEARRLVSTLIAMLAELEGLISLLSKIDAAMAVEPSRNLMAARIEAVREICLVEHAIRETGGRYAPHDDALDGTRHGVDWRTAAPSWGAS
jgi:hypothetical protein